MSLKIALIHPPVTKACEPPAGIAQLSACLQANDISHRIIDANLEGIQYLLQNPGNDSIKDNWTLQSIKHLEKNIKALNDNHTYGNISRYGRKVMDINRVLKTAGKPYDVDLSLADYQSIDLIPVKSHDLIQSAERPEVNPFYPYFSTMLLPLLKENPDYIGFSLNYLSQALCTFSMIGLIKQKNPKQKIVLGGSLTTSWLKITKNTSIFSGLVDHMISGAGEAPLLKLFQKEKSVSSELFNYKNFKLDDYFSPGIVLPISASRGCYWHKCSFCPEKAEDNPYMSLSSQRVINEISTFKEQNPLALIHFLDNAVSPALMNTLIETKRSVPWYGFSRVTPQLTDPEFCRGLKQSGCVMLKLGIESGDQGVLDKLEKGVSIEEMSAALFALHNAGIATYVYLLFGTPAETESSAVKTLDFASKHRSCIDFLNLAVFNLPALSIEAKKLDTYEFYEGDLSLYKNFHHPHGWDRQRVRTFLDKTLKKSKEVSSILKNTPPLFTSNHAPFLIMNEGLKK